MSAPGTESSPVGSSGCLISLNICEPVNFVGLHVLLHPSDDIGISWHSGGTQGHGIRFSSLPVQFSVVAVSHKWAFKFISIKI